MEEQGQIVEPFCGACIAAPIALMGVGATAWGGTSKDKHKTWKKVMFWSGIATVVTSIGVIIYFLFIRKCSDCR